MSFLTASTHALTLHFPGERGGRDIGILGGAQPIRVAGAWTSSRPSTSGNTEILDAAKSESRSYNAVLIIN